MHNMVSSNPKRMKRYIYNVVKILKRRLYYCGGGIHLYKERPSVIGSYTVALTMLLVRYTNWYIIAGKSCKNTRNPGNPVNQGNPARKISKIQ